MFLMGLKSLRPQIIQNFLAILHILQLGQADGGRGVGREGRAPIGRRRG
jgi:hypothetical protein